MLRNLNRLNKYFNRQIPILVDTCSFNFLKVKKAFGQRRGNCITKHINNFQKRHLENINVLLENFESRNTSINLAIIVSLLFMDYLER